jgi:NAD(P)-dependent dehydrogenase (short-subunit alcohol dehydrogenase family)
VGVNSLQNFRDLDRLYERIESEKGKIDILVTAAGFIDPETSCPAPSSSFVPPIPGCGSA